MTSTIADKAALAGIIAAYLVGREIALADELAERGRPELERDDDFLSLLDQRARCCPDCSVWFGGVGDDGPDECPECGDFGDWS